MAFSALRVISSLNSRRLISSIRSPLTVQLRYLRDRLTPISKCNCRLVSLDHRRLLRLPERFLERTISCQSFVRWNSSSSASSGVQNAGVSLFMSLNCMDLDFV